MKHSKPSTRKSAEHRLKWITELVLVFLLCFLVLPNFVCRFVIVNGESMDVTLKDGEVILSDVFTGNYGNLHRGDVVTVKGKDTEDVWIKRVVGLPGETIEIKDDKVYIDEAVLVEVYLNEAYVKQEQMQHGSFMQDMEAVTLGADEYFLLGDNRNHSHDSRAAGAFTREEIMGVARVVLFPFDRIGVLRVE